MPGAGPRGGVGAADANNEHHPRHVNCRYVTDNCCGERVAPLESPVTTSTLRDSSGVEVGLCPWEMEGGNPGY